MAHRRAVMIGLASLGLIASKAPKRTARFTADLRGDQPPANTGSTATGKARIAVDLEARAVDLDLNVVGLRIDQLWDRLMHAPIGPIHFHHYGSMHHASDDPAVSLVLPVPFGPSYAATRTGFKVTMRGFSYAAGAALLKSDKSFDDFMAAMRMGMVALNVHTNAFTDGEINGAVLPAG
jgi:hypothetical protein